MCSSATDRPASRQRVSVGVGGVEGNNDSFSPVLSRTNADVIAFSSFATNLAAGTENMSMLNAFVRVRSTGVTQRVDQNFGGVNTADGQNVASSLSGDGRYVGFTSNATDVLPGDTTGGNEAYLRDRVTNTTERVDVQTGGNGTASLEGANPQLSADRAVRPLLVAARADDQRHQFRQRRVPPRPAAQPHDAGGADAVPRPRRVRHGHARDQRRRQVRADLEPVGTDLRRFRQALHHPDALRPQRSRNRR